jgi:endonuclease YncB( thermonuclease family)
MKRPHSIVRANRGRIAVGFLVGVVAWLAAAEASADLESYANVRSDASLLVGSRVVHLFGIYVPPQGRTCRTNLRPVKCGTNAVLALDFKIRGFVQCAEVDRHPDYSITAVCHNKGVDLAAYLVERGWAVALPHAPFAYQVLERIARKRSMSVWGMHGIAITP